MSLKYGLPKYSSRLCEAVSSIISRNIYMGISKNLISNDIRMRQFLHKNINFRFRLKHCLSTNSCYHRVSQNMQFLDTGQRQLHVGTILNNDKVTATVEREDHEHLVIEPPVPFDVLLARLKECTSVKEQMMTLCSTLSLTPEDIEKRISLCDNITNMLSPFFHDFKVQLYGSSVNSFGFKGCDIDMSFSANVHPDDVMKTSFDDSDIPSVEDVLNGIVSPDHLSKLAPRDQLLFIHFVFLDYFKESTIAPMFINAYVPIIRFNYDKYNLKCDLSTGNKTALGNTKLLYMYGKLDERVAPLMMTIRYWAKHVGLIGGGLMFNTYTVSLMVIYFLQTRNPPVLPSAEYMLSVSEAIHSNIVCDERMLKELEMIPPSKNTESLEELFREFFFYYLYFDFSHVICPLHACSVPRDIFCINEKNKKFRVNTICIQDPIKLSHNVANIVDYKHCRKFAHEMLSACNFLQDKEFWHANSDEWGLMSILNRPEVISFNDEAFLNFKIPLKSFCTQEIQKEEASLVQTMSDLILKILEQSLLFKCECVQSTAETNIDDGALLFSMKCAGNRNTWLGRNCVDISDISASDPLELEHCISLKLLDREKEEKRREFIFYCKGYLMRENNQTFIHIKLTPTGKAEFSPVLGIFLKEYLPKTIAKLL